MMNTYGDGKYFSNIIKTTFNDEDIFKKFGEWCVENDVLQFTEGVY